MAILDRIFLSRKALDLAEIKTWATLPAAEGYIAQIGAQEKIMGPARILPHRDGDVIERVDAIISKSDTLAG